LDTNLQHVHQWKRQPASRTPFYVQIASQGADTIADSWVVSPWGIFRLGDNDRPSQFQMGFTLPPSAAKHGKPYSLLWTYSPPGWLRFNTDLPKMVKACAPSPPFRHITTGPKEVTCYAYADAVVRWLMAPLQLQDTTKGVTLKGYYNFNGKRHSNTIKATWHNGTGELVFSGTMPPGCPTRVKCPFTDWKGMFDREYIVINQFGLRCSFGFPGTAELSIQFNTDVVVTKSGVTDPCDGMWPE
jgi:hypothetical protein